MSASGLDCNNSAECSSSSRPTNVSDCLCFANPGDKCPLHWAVLQHDNLECLAINPEAEGMLLRLIYNDPTLLRSVVVHNKLDLVCLMVYYGTIFEVPNGYPYGPLEYAVEFNHVEIAKVLVHFYDNLYFRNDDKNRFSQLLVNCGGSDPTLFKLLLRKIGSCNVSQIDSLLHYFLHCELICSSWSTVDWLECLYLIVANVTEPQSRFFWQRLFDMFKKKNVQREDRLKLIYICLSFGYYVQFWLLNYLYKLFGFGDELEAFIYSMGHYYGYDNPCTLISAGSYADVQLVLPMTANPEKSKFIDNDSQRKFDWYSEFEVKQEVLGHYHGRYFLSAQNKRFIKRLMKKLVPLIPGFKEEIVNKLKDIPEFPSLLELARNQIRETIYNLVQYPYQFHDRVKLLQLPCLLKDMVCLKANIYR